MKLLIYSKPEAQGEKKELWNLPGVNSLLCSYWHFIISERATKGEIDSGSGPSFE